MTGSAVDSVAQRRLPRRFIDTVDQQTRVPVGVVWELTSACDLGCQHCGSRAGRKLRSELSTEECLDIVTQLAALGVRDVGLIGGETYLRRDWATIIRAIRDVGMDCSLQTGGRNMNDKRLDEAAAAGLQGMGISIDGLNDTHDFLRGVKGSFAATQDLLRRLGKYDITVGVNTQVNKLSMPELSALLDILVENGVHNWQLALTVAMGNAADHPELILQPYELLDLFPMLSDLHSRARSRGITLQPSNNIGYFGPYELQLRYVNDAPVHWTGCGAGDNVLGIEADGTVKGCPGFSKDYAGGNLREEPLVDIWARADALAFVRRSSVENLWGFCQTCYYAEVCMAGCTWTSHSLLGRPGNNPLCHYRALEFDRQGLRERVVPVEKAPGTRFDYGRYDLIVEPKPPIGSAQLLGRRDE
jgi:radical SAM protein with 4Fe4S-binding SPASM domain